MDEKKISNNNIEDIDKKTNQKETFIEKPDKKDIRNIIWIIMLFIIMFIVLISLPYISNYR